MWGRQCHLIYIHNNLIFDAWVNSQLVKGIVAANGRSFACACRGIITVRWEHVYPTWILGILDWETSKTTRFEPTDILLIRGQKWHCPPSQCPPLPEVLYIPPHPLPIFFTPLHLTPSLSWLLLLLGIKLHPLCNHPSTFSFFIRENAASLATLFFYRETKNRLKIFTSVYAGKWH